MQGMQELMQQAQEMQKRMQEMQAEMGKRTVEASAGGGMVTVVASCDMQVQGVKIDQAAVDPRDVGMLEDLVRAATNEALKKAKETMQAEMGKLTGGINMPSLF